MNLDPGESAEVQISMPPDASWPVILTVTWTGRGGNVVPGAEGVIEWTPIPRPLHRRIWSFITGRYAQDYIGWPVRPSLCPTCFASEDTPGALENCPDPWHEGKS